MVTDKVFAFCADTSLDSLDKGFLDIHVDCPLLLMMVAIGHCLEAVFYFLRVFLDWRCIKTCLRLMNDLVPIHAEALHYCCPKGDQPGWVTPLLLLFHELNMKVCC